MNYLVLRKHWHEARGVYFTEYYAGRSIAEAEQVMEDLEHEDAYPCLVQILRWKERKVVGLSHGYSEADAARLRVWSEP